MRVSQKRRSFLEKLAPDFDASGFATSLPLFARLMMVQKYDLRSEWSTKYLTVSDI